MSRQTTQKLSQAAGHQVDRIANAASDALEHAHDVADRAVSSAQERAQNLASQAPGDDFYVRSSIEARIRELQTQLDEARKENGGKPLPRERWRDSMQHDHAPLSSHAH